MAENSEIRKKVLTRQSKMEDHREPFGEDWLDIAKYAIPFLENMDHEEDYGDRIGTHIYDATPVSYLQMMADGFQGNTATSSKKWHRFIHPDPKLMELRTVKQWCQDMDEHFYYLFQTRSNFYKKIPSFYILLVGFAVGTVFIDEDLNTDQIKFIVPNPWEMFVEKNKDGEIDTYHRQFYMSARNIGSMFEHADLSPAVLDAIKTDPDKKFTIIHAVFPNEDRQYYKTGAQDKKFASVYVLKESSEYERSNLLRRKGTNVAISGYDEMPYITGVWRDTPNTPYSFGPGHTALPQLLMLNDAAKRYWIATQKLVDPPMWLPLKYREFGFSLAPEAKNWYEEEKIMDVSPIQQTIDIAALLEGINDLREQISKIFMVDFWRMMTDRDANVTATQIIREQGEQAVALGPMLDSLHSFFNHMFDRLVSIEAAANRLPVPPDEIIEAGGEYRVEYVGPMAQAQKRLFEIQGTMNFIEQSAPVFQLYPPSMDKVDFDKLVDKIGNSSGADLDIIREDKDVEAIRAARAKAAEEARQAEMAEKLAKTTKDMGQPVADSSLLGQMQQGQQDQNV